MMVEKISYVHIFIAIEIIFIVYSTIMAGWAGLLVSSLIGSIGNMILVVIILSWSSYQTDRILKHKSYWEFKGLKLHKINKQWN